MIKLYGRLPGSRGDYYRPAKIKGTVSAEINGDARPKADMHEPCRAEERLAAAVVQEDDSINLRLQ